MKCAGLLAEPAVGFYEECFCAPGAEVIDGVCQTRFQKISTAFLVKYIYCLFSNLSKCKEGLVLDSTGTFCYDGIDSSFDRTLYNCEADETDLLLEDLDFNWGLSLGFIKKHRVLYEKF